MHLAKNGMKFVLELNIIIKGKKRPNSLIVNQKDIIIYILLVNIITCLTFIREFYVLQLYTYIYIYDKISIYNVRFIIIILS